MTTEAAPITLKNQTQFFTLEDFSTKNSKLTMTAGPFTLVAKTLLERFEHEFYYPPTFCMDLTKSPFGDKTECDKGTDLTNILQGSSFGPAQSSSGMQTDFIYEAQQVKFITLNCQLFDWAPVTQ